MVVNNDVVKSVGINYIDEENELQFCKCFKYYDYYVDDEVNVTLDGESANDLINAVDNGDIIYASLIINSFNCVTDIEAATKNVHEGTISYITTNKIKLTDGS